MKIIFKNFLGTIESFLRNDTTAVRNYQFPNKDITVAGIDDITPTQIGLQNVNNTSDLNKPVSTAQQTVFDTKLDIANSGVTLVDGATIDLTGPKHILSTSASTRTFTISYNGDETTVEVTLNTTLSTFTFPIGSLCSSDGLASGDNTCVLNGSVGDVFMIGIKKMNLNYRVIVFNFK